MASIKIIIALFGLFILALHQTESRPLSTKANTKRQAPENFGFPETVNVVTERASNSCFIVVTKQYTEERQVENPDGSISIVEQVVNVTRRECCPGYTGTECNQVVDPYQESNPCRGLICSNHPDAICAVVSKCGRDIPLFLDQSGGKVDCGNEDGSVPDINSLSCNGICTSNPCQDQICQANPLAVCLVRACDCTPMWFLETGEKIDCSTGENIPRKRRQTSDQNTSCRK